MYAIAVYMLHPVRKIVFELTYTFYNYVVVCVNMCIIHKLYDYKHYNSQVFVVTISVIAVNSSLYYSEVL